MLQQSKNCCRNPLQGIDIVFGFYFPSVVLSCWSLGHA